MKLGRYLLLSAMSKWYLRLSKKKRFMQRYESVSYAAVKRVIGHWERAKPKGAVERTIYEAEAGVD
jgi:hypothetical protein